MLATRSHANSPPEGLDQFGAEAQRWICSSGLSFTRPRRFATRRSVLHTREFPTNEISEIALYRTTPCFPSTPKSAPECTDLHSAVCPGGFQRFRRPASVMQRDAAPPLVTLPYPRTRASMIQRNGIAPCPSIQSLNSLSVHPSPTTKWWCSRSTSSRPSR